MKNTMFLRYDSSTTAYESDSILPSGTAVDIQTQTEDGRVKIASPVEYKDKWCKDFEGVIQSSSLDMGAISIDNSEIVSFFLTFI
eukprot:UN12043